MKKPVFIEADRRNWLVPKLEVFKMRIRRSIDRSWYGKLNYKILDCGVDVAYKLFKQYRPFKLQEIINLTKTKNTVERH